MVDFNPKKYLGEIGDKKSDFEDIPKGEKSYSYLGKGNFGFTLKMKSKKNGKIYAVKILDKNSKKFKEKDFERETKISIDLDHENLVRFYGYFEDIEKIERFKEIYKGSDEYETYKNETKDRNVYCLVLEFASNGSLEGYFNNYVKQQNKKYASLPQNIVIKYLRQLLNGLKYLHGYNIAHRDIKPDNILLDENNNIKIADFGISAIFKQQNQGQDNNNQNNEDIDQILISGGKTKVGRRDFICPEIEKGISYDCRCDIYSLGLTILCLMSTEKPIKLKEIQYPLKKKKKNN